MKIRRIRRGFTTNSSASTEWVPPPPNQAGASNSAGQPAVTVPGGTSGNGNVSGGQLASNTLTIGGVLLAFLSVFLVERVIKWLLARRRSSAKRNAEIDVADDE